MVKEEEELWLAAEKTFINARTDAGRDGINADIMTTERLNITLYTDTPTQRCVRSLFH